MTSKKQTTMHHLKEAQFRLFFVAAFFIAGATLAYYFQAQLIDLILAPLHGQKLIYLNPAGGFSFIFLVSIYAGIALAFPVLLQQIYAFLRPALPEKAQKKSPKIIISSFILLVAGITFGYLVAVPNALQFLYSFAETYIEASLTADSYLNFIIAYTIGIGIVFQVPLLLLLIHSIKPLTPSGLIKSEKWVIVLAFIAAAIITPTPDPINQAIIAGPVIVVYQIGVFIILFSIFRAWRTKRSQLKRMAKRTAKLQVPSRPVSPPLPIPTATAQPLSTILVDSLKPSLPPPAQPTPQQKKVQSIDGFTRRSSVTLIVPQRQVPTNIRPLPTRPIEKRASSPRFYIDGVSMRAQSY